MLFLYIVNFYGGLGVGFFEREVWFVSKNRERKDFWTTDKSSLTGKVLIKWPSDNFTTNLLIEELILLSSFYYHQQMFVVWCLSTANVETVRRSESSKKRFYVRLRTPKVRRRNKCFSGFRIRRVPIPCSDLTESKYIHLLSKTIVDIRTGNGEIIRNNICIIPYVFKVLVSLCNIL
mgnify:CR=1 FL=1